MKELDFDELDRAVNSLMKSAPKSDNAPKPDDDVNVVDLTPNEPKVEPVANTPVSTPTPSANLAGSNMPLPSPSPVDKKDKPAAVSSVASRRGGRFMDVVHPSSDMKKSTTPSVPARPVSRQGTTIEPGREISKPVARSLATPTARPTDEKPLEKKEDIKKSDTPTPASSVGSASTQDWPDPLDMANFKDDTPAPLTTPFLPDTKVEKRPLGSAAPTATAVPNPSESLSSSVEEPDRAPVLGEEADKPAPTKDNPDDQLPATPAAETELVLPEELQDDLMVVEADTHMGMPKTEDLEEKHEEKEKPKPEKKPHHEEAPVWKKPEELKDNKDEKPKASPLATPPTPALEAPDEPRLSAGPTSIPQQYREEPSTGDQENGAIYDTDTYHQPLSHPAKKKSGWTWVIWIALILLVGAGSGAALYFFGIV